MSKTVVTEKVGQTFLMVHGAQNPADAEWKAGIAKMREGGFTAMLVSTDGATLNTLQRNDVRDAMGERPPPTAVLTDSRVALGVLSVLRLFLKENIQGFSQSRLDDALAFLAVLPGARGDIERALERLRLQVRP